VGEERKKEKRTDRKRKCKNERDIGERKDKERGRKRFKGCEET
jgi:hypothetical protein